MASSGASAAATTPATTPATTEQTKKDIAWEWAENREPNPDKVWCKLCDKKMSGGIRRFKEHACHIKGNVTSCPKVTTAIQQKIIKQMQDYSKTQTEKKRIRGIMQQSSNSSVGLDANTVDIDEEPSGQPSGSSVPGINTSKKRIVSSNVRGPMDAIFKVDKGKLKQASLDTNNPFKKKLKEVAWEKISQWAYEVGLPFNAVRAPSFEAMVHAIGDYGRALPAPSYYNMRVTLLKTQLERTKEFVDSFRPLWKQFGCSLSSDFWTDNKDRSLINFLVSCPKGTVFLKSIDCSSIIHSATEIVTMFEEVIEDVGVENIIQIVTDNGANMKSAGQTLENMHPTLFWTPCAAHCVNLMLEDCGKKIPKIFSVLADARALVVYIYNHGRVLHMMRKLCGKELHRAAETRFATNFYTLRSIHENRCHLSVLFVSEWWVNNRFSKEDGGRRVARIVAKQAFWDDVLFACQVMAPLVDVVRLVDIEEKPSMGYIYEAMDRAKEQIKKNLGTNIIMQARTWKLIDDRWNDQLHHPLHAAAFYLNPSIYYKQDPDMIEANEEIKQGLHLSIARIVPQHDHDAILVELVRYRNADGSLGSPFAIRQRDSLQPSDWWVSYGSSVPILQKFAKRILGQTCSSSSCERNWSTFDHLHAKKRNKLLQQKLNDLVYIQYNRKLELRCIEKKNKFFQPNNGVDPIFLKEVDENDEWITPNAEELAEYADEDRALTWHQVREAQGVTEVGVGPGTRTRSRVVAQPVDEFDEDLEVGDMEGMNVDEVLLDDGDDEEADIEA